ncbi:MAG: permease [Lentisphaeria bacterium]|nr:permease [Lentisphaeria bacterium]
MTSDQTNLAEAARGWTDVVSEWLTDHVSSWLSFASDWASPEVFDGLTQALATFIFIFTELMILFVIISFVIGVVQQYIPPERIQKYLSGKRSYALAAILGAITPFCSCSTIPFLKGLIRAKAGFGGIIVFLLASPLLNPVIIGLFVMAFGWKVALYYFVMAFVVSVIAGVILEKLGFEKYIRPIHSTPNEISSCAVTPVETSCCSSKPIETSSCAVTPVETSCCSSKPIETSSCAVTPVETSCCITLNVSGHVMPTKAQAAWHQTKLDLKQAFPYIVLGVLIGSIIYGFLPTDLITKYAGSDNIFAVPVSAVIGIPLYLRAEAVIPISLGLVKKGMGLGAVMALIIGSAGASITELILLRSLFKKQLIIAFLGTVLGMAILAGYFIPIFF